MCGQHPATYDIENICATERSALLTFVDNLKEYQTEKGESIGLLQVLADNPLGTRIPREARADIFMRNVGDQMKILKELDGDFETKIDTLIQNITPDVDTRQQIADETTDQANCKTWHNIRKGRITGSVCDRVISFTGRTPATKLVNDLFKPPSFSTAATQFGIQNEPIAISLYTARKQSIDQALTVGSAGFYIDTQKGYLGVSPDGVITCGDGTRGILEVKCPIKWSDITPTDAVGCATYPLTRRSEVDERNKIRISFALKQNHKWYHQIQMQLYCCRDFARFLDFAMYHYDSKYIHIERFELQDVWVQKNIPKMDQFFRRHMAQRLLA